MGLPFWEEVGYALDLTPPSASGFDGEADKEMRILVSLQYKWLPLKIEPDLASSSGGGGELIFPTMYHTPPFSVVHLGLTILGPILDDQTSGPIGF